MCGIHDNEDEAFLLNIDKKKLLIEDYLSLIRDLPPSVTDIELVGGGEPLLFKEITLLFPLIKKRHLKGSLITNGSLLTEALCKILVDCRWDTVRISFNAASRETYSKIHRVDHFNLVLHQIKKLREIRGNRKFPSIGMNYILQKDNYRECVDFVRLANDLQVDRFSIENLIFCPASKELFLNEAEQKEALLLLREAETNAKIPHSIDLSLNSPNHSPNSSARRQYLENRWCPMVQNQLEIRSNGMALPCCMAFKIADPEISIKKLSIKKIWDQYSKFRRDLKDGKFYSFCYDRCSYTLPFKDKKFF